MTSRSVWLFLVVLSLASLCKAASGEPIIGGPCEGCENVFAGMPANPTQEARIAPVGEPGEPMVIRGTVRTLAGDPAPGVIVYAYHTNAAGIYPKADTRHGALRGWARTDAVGHYRFDTIRPGHYPGRHVPQHVHMHVVEPGYATYYVDSIVFDDDPLLTPNQIRDHYRGGRGGRGLAHPVKDEQGVWQVRRDIVLGKNVPGYNPEHD